MGGVRAVVAITLVCALGGCLPEPDLPRCPNGRDDECSAYGFCRCSDGLCFNFDCPKASDASNDVVVPPVCRADDGQALPDECVAASARLTGLPAAPAALGADGTLFVVTSGPAGATLRALTSGLEPRWEVDLPMASAPVVISDDRVAVRTPGGLAIVSADGSRLDLSAPTAPAGAPVQEPGTGDLLVADAGGHLLRFPAAGGSPARSNAPVMAATGSVELALAPDGLLWAVGQGVGLVRVVVGQTADAAGSVVTDAARTAPALDPPYVVVGTHDGVVSFKEELGQAVDAGSVTLDAGPSAPVIAADQSIVVALPLSIVGLRRVNDQTLTPGWTSGPMVGAVVTPPLLGADRVYVGLDNGRLVAVDTQGTTRWFVAADAAATGAPLQWPDGGLLHLDAAGGLLRVRADAPDDPHPWPRWRRDAQSSAVAL